MAAVTQFWSEWSNFLGHFLDIIVTKHTKRARWSEIFLVFWHTLMSMFFHWNNFREERFWLARMPFMKGIAPIRRTAQYLDNCGLVFKVGLTQGIVNENVSPIRTAWRSWLWTLMKPQKIADKITIQEQETLFFGTSLRYDHILWEILLSKNRFFQVQHKNPNVQIVTFKNLTPRYYIL